MEGYGEEEFNKNILDIFNMSELLHDNFKIHEKNQKFYLSKRDKIFIKNNDADQSSSDTNTLHSSEAMSNDVLDELFKDPASVEHDTAISKSLISIEHHVVLHPSYQVPTLYFLAHTGT